MGFGSTRHADADTNSYSDCNSDSYCYGHSYSDRNGYRNASAESNANGNVHFYSKTLPDSKRCPATKASADSAAAPVAGGPARDESGARSADARSVGLLVRRPTGRIGNHPDRAGPTLVGVLQR